MGSLPKPILLPAVLICACAACHSIDHDVLEPPAGETDTDADTDTDTDTDTDVDTDTDSDADTDSDSGTGSDTSLPPVGCERMDILFVTDISASMMQEKENLNENFPNFVSVLDDSIESSDTFTEYRVGVTNNSVNGVFGDCETTGGLDGDLYDGSSPIGGDCEIGSDPWLDGPDDLLSDKFTCMAVDPYPDINNLVDCGHEMPLTVIEMFGDKLGMGQPNEGFYRKYESSLLVIVALTDEDEDSFYSSTTPAGTKTYLDDLTGGDDRYVVVVIAGEQEGGCVSAFGNASEAVVLKQFVELLPNGFFGDICEGDLSTSLAYALDTMIVACDSLPDIE